MRALAGVDLDLRAGEIHALLGENGAGKSTLIKVLTGVHPADEGEVHLCGKLIRPGSPHEAEALGISTVYQEVNLVPTLSVAENLLLGRQPLRWGLIRWRECRKRARASLSRLGLDIDVDCELGSLPIALQQMVAIARALDLQARVLVLDEPTASLDEREVGELFALLRRLRDEGLGILFVTHFLDQVYALTDRITVLRNGSKVGVYSTASLPRLALVSAMIGREVRDDAARSAGLPEADDTATVALRASGLGRKGALHPTNLVLRKGEVMGLGGLLGSGRTELARLLFGLDPADTGDCVMDGSSAPLANPRQAIRQGLAFCSEDRKREGIFPNLSVRENMLIALQALRGMFGTLSAAEQDALCEASIKTLGIRTPDAETPIRNLSGGNQQKVLLARWLLTHPRVILLDEPTRGIDIGARAEIENLIGRLRSEGLSVLLISSEIEEVVRNSTRVTVLRERRVVTELRDAEITTAGLMAAMAGAGEGSGP